MTAALDPAAPASTGPIGLCLTCNYPLIGLPEPRCPECGRAFDPLDPTTMNMGRELSALSKWVLGPVRWPVSMASWAALLYALWSARLPGGQVRSSVSLYILLWLAGVWLIWPLVRVMAARRYGWPHSLLMRGQKQRVAVGVCLLLAVGLILVRLPLEVGFWISRPAMDRMAKSLIASHEPYGKDKIVGVYKALRVTAVPGGVRFTVEQEKRAYRSGFVFLPNVDPKHVSWSQRSYRYLGHGWWAWREEG